MISCGSCRFDNFTYHLLKVDFSINHAMQLTYLRCLRAHYGIKGIGCEIVMF